MIVVSRYLLVSVMLISMLAMAIDIYAVGGKTSGKRVSVVRKENTIRVEVDGKLLTEYLYKTADRPFFYPVVGSSGVNMTRNWPMNDSNKDEQTDHRHHRSLWFVHGDVNGYDFWSEGKGHRVEHQDFMEVESSGDSGVITSSSLWVADATGDKRKVVCSDTRTHRFYASDSTRMIDIEITMHASHGKIVLGDTKEGCMAIRVAPTMRLKGKVGKGHIVNSEGVRDNSAWGKRAAWCDYYGPVDGKTVGVAIFDHPENPRHPTWWHARNYGLMAANPFGIHYFEKNPDKHAGDMEIPDGESRTWRYRVYIHEGDEKQGRVAEAYAEFAGAGK